MQLPLTMPPPRRSGWSWVGLGIVRQPAVVAALVAAATFAGTLGGTFIYDDLPVILDDPRMSRPGLWSGFWTQGYLVGGVDHLYRPLTSMSFAFQRWIHGDRPWAFHGVNVLLHAGATAAVAEFARRLGGRRAAWIGGLLFAVHPLHVEDVAWLVGRAELACTLATFCGLCLMLGRPFTIGRGLAVVVCFAIALLSKEQGILFPLLALGCLGIRRRPLRGADAPPAGEERIGAAFSDRERERLKLLTASLLLLLAGYFLYREATISILWDRSRLDWSMQPMIRSAGADRWLLPVALFGRYLLLVIAPVHLSIEYGADVIGAAPRFGEPFFYVGVLGIAAWLAALAICVRRRSWGLAYCLMGFALSYGMIANAVALIGTIFGERLMYLPSAFLLAGVGAVAGRVRWPRGMSVLLLGGLTIGGAARSIAYARHWNDRRAFYEYSSAAQPRSVRLYELLFSECRRRGDWTAARAAAERCIAAVPGAYEGYLIRGEAALQQGDLAGARADLFAAADRGAGTDLIPLAVSLERRTNELSRTPATTGPTEPR